MILLKNHYFIPKLVTCIVGAAFGVFMIIYGIINPIYHYPSYLSSKTFGADYYTEQYNATASVVNRLNGVIYALDDIGRIVCIAIGVAFLLGFLLAFFCVLGKNQAIKVENKQIEQNNLMSQAIPTNNTAL